MENRELGHIGTGVAPNRSRLKSKWAIRVLVVDDDPAFLRAANDFLQQRNDILVVGVTSDAQQALLQAPNLRPQVILLDMALPGLSGWEAMPRFRQVLSDVGIIALAVFDEVAYRQMALAVGADDFVSKRKLNSDLMPAIQRVVSRP